MDGGSRSSPPRKAWESQDPLVRKYLRYRSASPTPSETSEEAARPDGPTPRASELSSRTEGPAPRPSGKSSRSQGSAFRTDGRNPRTESHVVDDDASSSPRGRPVSAAEPNLVPDRGLRSRLFSDRDGAIPSARPSRGPHGIDPAWYAHRPWKSARARILPLLFLLGGAWIALSLVFGTNGVVRLWELTAREKHLQAKLEEDSEEHDELQRELEEPAPLALERSAREKFDLQRPGEIVYRFPRVPAETFAPPDAPASDGAAPQADGPAPEEPTPAEPAASK